MGYELLSRLDGVLEQCVKAREETFAQAAELGEPLKPAEAFDLGYYAGFTAGADFAESSRP